jgi:hypothetical protein
MMPTLCLGSDTIEIGSTVSDPRQVTTQAPERVTAPSGGFSMSISRSTHGLDSVVSRRLTEEISLVTGIRETGITQGRKTGNGLPYPPSRQTPTRGLRSRRYEL